jgi:hypothetical protein
VERVTPVNFYALKRCGNSACFALARGLPKSFTFASGHTATNTPDLFRTPKLTVAGPGQYWGGGPPGKSFGCCWLFSRRLCSFCVCERLTEVLYFRQRPYRNEYTGSLPNSEVNRCRARSVLGWGTAWEVLWVLLAFFSSVMVVLRLRAAYRSPLLSPAAIPQRIHRISSELRS